MVRSTVTRLLIALVLLSLVLPTASAAPVSTSTSPPTPSAPVVVRVYYDDPAQLTQLVDFDVFEFNNRDEQYVLAAVDAMGLAALQQLGFRVEVDAKETAAFNKAPDVRPEQTNGIPGFPCYRTVEETFASAQNIVANYPQLATFVDVGNSWQKSVGLGGYDMNVLVLTNSATPGPKPKFFVTAAIHAREYTTAELVTRFAEYLVTRYGIDPDVTWILDNHEIHLMLHTNPDGRKQAETGLSWRKNTNQNYCGPTSQSRGADLNRNFAFQWGCCNGSSGSQCSETFRGASAASEPEVQAVQNYMRAIFPDQRADPPTSPAPADATGLYLDVHSYSQLVLWPWGYTTTVAPNGVAMQTLGRKFAYFNGYTPEQSVDLYITDGTTDDFAYGDLGVAAYTFELGTDFFQSCSVFENTILPSNMSALLYAAKVPRTPYLTPAGPDTLNVAVAPVLVTAGDPVNLSATANDTRFNNSNGTEPTQAIAAAEYYIDVPPWQVGAVAHAMAAADGAFNSTIEGVVATINTTGLTGGRHMVFVRARDAANSWGAISAAFLYIATGNEGSVAGSVIEQGSGRPLAATVTIMGPNIAANTNAQTGMFSRTAPAGAYSVVATAADHNSVTINNVSISDGNITPLNFVLPLMPGACTIGSLTNIAYSNDFETNSTGWTHSGSGDSWALVGTRTHSGAKAWRATAPATTSDQRLVSPSITVPSGQTPVNLRFWNYQMMESRAGGCYDGGILEVSTNAGSTWTQITSGLLTDPYDGPFGGGNPLGTVNAWCGSPQDWLNSIVNLAPYAGQTVQFRWRLGTDSGVGTEGWYIDDVAVQACIPQACWWPDVNCSCVTGGSTTIDIYDLTVVANAWALYNQSGTYSQAADISCRAAGGCDNVIDIVDVQTAASMWGAACPNQGLQ